MEIPEIPQEACYCGASGLPSPSKVALLKERTQEILTFLSMESQPGPLCIIALCFVPGSWPPVLRGLSYNFLTLGFPAKCYTRASLKLVYKRVVVLWVRSIRDAFTITPQIPFYQSSLLHQRQESILYHCWGHHTTWSWLSSLIKLISKLSTDMSSLTFSW